MLYVPPQREPVLNIPTAIVALITVFTLIHMGRLWGGDATNVWIMENFAFIPARYGELPHQLAFLRQTGPMLVSPISYALLHGEWSHLVFNALWLVVFGTPVARRFGTLRFCLFLIPLALAGALAHWLTDPHALAPMIGASAIVSGLMAAALRFIFQTGGPLGAFQRGHAAHHVPALPLARLASDGRVMGFILVWALLNAVTGLMSDYLMDGMSIAWQAHMGGFIAGLLLFDVFDPR